MLPAKFGSIWLAVSEKKIGQAVSEKKKIKIFSHRGSMLKLCRLMSAVLVGGSPDTILKGDHLKDHPCRVWSKLAQWFQRRTLKCKKLTTNDRRGTDG